MYTIEKIKAELESRKGRSAWDRGVTVYALELLDEYSNNYGKEAAAPCKIDLLNGADTWSQYSYGGCSLVYDGDIAERLCSQSELKKTKNGEHRPNANEEWLDVQARALNQACRRILSIAKSIS